MDITKARELAAQAWCSKETEKTEMDADLAEAFAQILMTVVGELADPPLRAIPGNRRCETVKDGKSVTRIQWVK